MPNIGLNTVGIGSSSSSQTDNYQTQGGTTGYSTDGSSQNALTASNGATINLTQDSPEAIALAGSALGAGFGVAQSTLDTANLIAARGLAANVTAGQEASGFIQKIALGIGILILAAGVVYVIAKHRGR